MFRIDLVLDYFKMVLENKSVDYNTNYMSRFRHKAIRTAKPLYISISKYIYHVLNRIQLQFLSRLKWPSFFLLSRSFHFYLDTLSSSFLYWAV